MLDVIPGNGGHSSAKKSINNTPPLVRQMPSEDDLSVGEVVVADPKSRDTFVGGTTSTTPNIAGLTVDLAGDVTTGVASSAELAEDVIAGVASLAKLAEVVTVGMAPSPDLAGDVTVGVVSLAEPAGDVRRSRPILLKLSSLMWSQRPTLLCSRRCGVLGRPC